MSQPVPTARDLMNTALRTVYASQDVEDVDLKMKLANIHHLPVLDDEQKLVGIVTHGGLVAALRDKGVARKPIETIMERDVVTVPPSMAADEIIKLMIEKRIGCVPVIEEDGTLAGILTETDFLHLALAHVREKAQRFSNETGYHR